MATIELTVDVPAPMASVWARVTSPVGINDELRPWLAMRMPRGVRGQNLDTLPLGVPLGRAWLSLFGVLPVEYDRLALAAVTPGRSFHETSTMLTMRRWEHERTLTARSATSTSVTDRLTFQPRLRFVTPVAERILRALFRHRHRRLLGHFH